MSVFGALSEVKGELKGEAAGAFGRWFEARARGVGLGAKGQRIARAVGATAASVTVGVLWQSVVPNPLDAFDEIVESLSEVGTLVGEIAGTAVDAIGDAL